MAPPMIAIVGVSVTAGVALWLLAGYVGGRMAYKEWARDHRGWTRYDEFMARVYFFSGPLFPLYVLGARWIDSRPANDVKSWFDFSRR